MSVSDVLPKIDTVESSVNKLQRMITEFKDTQEETLLSDLQRQIS